MAKKKTSDLTPAQGAKRVAKRIKDVDEMNKYAKVLVFGRNKKGKTVFGASAPRTFIVDIDEEGTRSAVGSGARVFEARSFDEVAHSYWYLKYAKHPYKVVSLDTITALYAAAMRKVLGESEDRDPTKEKGQPRRQDWGRANQLVNDLLLNFRNLPMHVVFLAQERTIQDDDEDEPSFHTVQLPAGARATALGCVGIIGRIYLVEARNKKTRKKGWEARMLVGPHEEYDTGNRVDSLPRIIRNPTMPKIIKAWRETPPKESE